MQELEIQPPQVEEPAVGPGFCRAIAGDDDA
jgi:hypothetical protein